MSAKVSLVIWVAIALLIEIKYWGNVWAFVASVFQMINSLRYLWFEIGNTNIDI